MHFLTKILFINCLLLHGLQGMDLQSRGVSPKDALLKKLKEDTSWEDRKDVITKLITEHSMHPDAIRYDFQQSTFPLYDAVNQGDIEFTRFLLKHGASVEQRVNTILHRNDPLLFCAASTKMAQLLLDHKASVHEKGGRYCSMPLLYAAVQFNTFEPDLITLYGKHGVDASAVAGDGASPLHQLIIGSADDDKRLERAQKLIEVGVSLDPQMRCGTWGSMTFITRLKVKIKKLTNEGWTLDAKKEVALLEGVKRAVDDRNKRIFEAVYCLLLKDTSGIVLSYCVDQEEFDQTDEEIDKLAQQVARKQQQNARTESIGFALGARWR